MEFRDKLLSSELRHMTEMVNLLSCELVILQDFVTEVFGPKYRKFRNGHALAGEGVLPLGSVASSGRMMSKQTSVTRSSINVSKPQPTRSRRGDPPDTRSGRGRQVDTGNDEADPTIATQIVLGSSKYEIASASTAEGQPSGGGVGEHEQPLSYSDLDDLSMDVDGGKDDNEGVDFDPLSSDSDYDKTDADWTELGFKRNSAKIKNIWLKFNCTKLPDGKKEVICRKCDESVSPVAKRLQKHYNRCVLGLVEVSPGPVFIPGRKPKGEVWAHFERDMTEDGQVIVTCNYCKRRVSNHATRMSRHLHKNCPKFPGLGESQT